jgi:hypothetical protein
MARKSRQHRYFPERTEAKWKAGVYTRLYIIENNKLVTKVLLHTGEFTASRC